MAPQSTSNDITTGHDLSTVLPRLAETLAGAVGADHCTLFAYSEDKQSNIGVYRYGKFEHEAYQDRSNDLLPPAQTPAEAYILETGQPLARVTEEDFARYPVSNADNARLEGRLTDLTIPLIWEGEVQGAAYLWRTMNPTPYSQEEIQSVLDLSQLAGMCIVFARQYALERRQRSRMDTLLHAADISASGQGLDDVLQVLSGAIRSATGADVCTLSVFDEARVNVLTTYQEGLSDEEQQQFSESRRFLPVGEVRAETRAMRTLRPVMVRESGQDFAESCAFAGYVTRSGVSEMLLVPINWQHETIGFVYCWYRRSDQRFSQESIDTAEAIARQAGGVISRSRMEAELHQQTIESDVLLRIGQAVLTSDTLPPVLDEIAHSLETLVPFDYAYVGELTRDGRSLRVIREWGNEFRPILGMSIPVGASLSGAAVRNRQLVSAQEVRDDSRAWRDIPRGKPIQTIMVSPLAYDNRILGVIFLGRRTPEKFSPREEQMLTLVSQQAAVAMERVQAREALAIQFERQAFLARVGDALVSSEDLENALQEIANLASGVIADGVVFGLAGSEHGSIDWVADSFHDPVIADRLHQGLHHFDMEILREPLESVLLLNEEFPLSLFLIWNEHRFLREFIDSLGVSHVMAFPLYQQERAPGLMILLSQNTETPYAEAEVELGRIVAQRIGDALDRQTIERNHEALLRISEALHGQSDLDELVRTIAAELEHILPCDQMIVADFDRDERMLHTQVYRNRGSEHPGREYFPVDEGICGEAWRLQQPIMDNMADQRGSSIYGNWTERSFYQSEGESALATPLMVENEPIGVLFMNRTGHHRFTTSDFETFLLFAGLASAALDRTTLEHHNRTLYRASTEVLAAVVDAKDPMTHEHSRHVSFYSRILAELMELPADEIERIELSGLLHDVGKLGIPDRILQKPGRLSDDEYELIKTHPDRGARILAQHPALTELIPMVRHHHEAYDGRGYPTGLEGNEIPLGASIICVADAFDTMTSKRTYQAQRTVDEALQELLGCAGTQFHPELVRRFVEHARHDHSLVRRAGSTVDSA